MQGPNQKKQGRKWFSDSLRLDNKETLSIQQLEEGKEKTGLLTINECKVANIIPILKQVPFKFIKSLSLEKCNLYSIEGITQLQAPSLKEIRVCYNKIISVKTIRKGNWPYLSFLNLKQNPISDLHYLAELKMNANFESLTLSTRIQSDKVIKQDLHWIAKLQPENFNNINCHHVNNEEREYYYYQSPRSSLELAMIKRISYLKKKFLLPTFSSSNCYDLH